ncbi:hypothetical protein PABG_07628 [Paracoccidioides brasiliensis Pb03]|nr:hypothetical protein PABG_07628 [Paracoccidioides brasiliensis Pb03]
MISNDQLYQFAIFLGSSAMLLIILYHFLEINAKDSPNTTSASEEPLVKFTQGATPVESSATAAGGGAARQEEWRSGMGCDWIRPDEDENGTTFATCP